MTDAPTLVDEYKDALQRVAELKANERAAEERVKIVFSTQVLAAGDVSAAKAEHVARASKEYEVAVAELKHARAAAGLAEAHAEYLRVRWETWRTRMSMRKTVIGAKQ